MICPTCSHEATKVIDSRMSENGLSIRRRRACEKCEFRFTTFERMQTTNLMVEKRNGELEPYDREKLERSIMIACVKRPVSIKQVRDALTTLEETKWAKAKVVNSDQLGDDVMGMLKTLDPVAYIRFVSVYKRFTNMQTFRQEIEDVFSDE